MSDQDTQELQRILEMVRNEKIRISDAVKLIHAMLPGASRVSEEGLSTMIEMALSDKLDLDDLANMLSLPKNDGASRWENKKANIRQSIAEAVHGAFHNRNKQDSSRLLRISVSSAEGDDVSVNIPLGLANFALKLIPKEAQRTMNEQGLNVETLTEMLHADLPDGQLVSVDSSDGTSVSITIY